MKSVDALRKWADGLSGVWIDPNDHTITITTGWDAPPDMDSVSLRDHVNGILDGIEREVADMVPLPVDADGEAIHVGDVMCGYGWPNGGVYCRAIVNEVTILVGPQDGAYRGWLMWAANECRHYHAPTVEDVLEEFVARWMETHHDDIPALKAEYAAKLRLKEG